MKIFALAPASIERSVYTLTYTLVMSDNPHARIESSRDRVASLRVREALETLKDARLSANLTQQDLEQELILGPGWVSAFEQGPHVW